MPDEVSGNINVNVLVQDADLGLGLGGTPTMPKAVGGGAFRPQAVASPLLYTQALEQVTTKKRHEELLAPLKFLAGGLGIGMLIKQSQILNMTTSAMFQVIGALVDTILAPLIPVLVPILRAMGALVAWVQKFMTDPTAAINEAAKALKEGVKEFGANFPKMIRELFSSLVTLNYNYFMSQEQLGRQLFLEILPSLAKFFWDANILGAKEAWNSIVELFKAAIRAIPFIGERIFPSQAPAGGATSNFAPFALAAKTLQMPNPMVSQLLASTGAFVTNIFFTNRETTEDAIRSAVREGISASFKNISLGVWVP